MPGALENGEKEGETRRRLRARVLGVGGGAGRAYTIDAAAPQEGVGEPVDVSV